LRAGLTCNINRRGPVGFPIVGRRSRNAARGHKWCPQPAGCDLEGNVQRITCDVVDKEPAELEAFADAVANGVKFVIAPEEIVNTVAVTEAIAAASRGGKAVTIR
jgi:predicted dehydrogenase